VADERSNKHLLDTGEAQSLDAGAIAELKREGGGGAAVVAALVARSATFESKTAFSQDKYLARKKRKHCARGAALRPTAARVAEVLFARAPDRCAYLRPDTLALALAFADAGARSRALVLDGTGGVVTAASLERLYDPFAAPGAVNGCVCVVHFTREAPSLDAVRFLNFEAAALELLWRAPLTLLEDACQPVQSIQPEPPAPPGEARPRAPPPPGSGRVQAAQPHHAAAWMAAGGFTSLLAAAPAFDPTAALRRLLPLLAGGAPFALFANSLQPLADAAAALRQERLAALVEIHEPWLRSYQVLPQRSHPMMAMHANAGYLLVGFRLLNE